MSCWAGLRLCMDETARADESSAAEGRVFEMAELGRGVLKGNSLCCRVYAMLTAEE